MPLLAASVVDLDKKIQFPVNKEWPLWFAACPRIGQLRGLSDARWWTALTVKIDSTVGASWRLTMADLRFGAVNIY